MLTGHIANGHIWLHDKWYPIKVGHVDPDFDYQIVTFAQCPFPPDCFQYGIVFPGERAWAEDYLLETYRRDCLNAAERLALHLFEDHAAELDVVTGEALIHAT